MFTYRLSTCSILLVLVFASFALAQSMPFQHSVEVYRDQERDVTAFVVRLEQPFLAEEFEQSNYLRLRSEDDNAYLIYPTQTRFKQKHAEFYGRIRGSDDVVLKLSYETVSENLDGSRLVQAREGEITVDVPVLPVNESTVGSESIFKQWATEQNRHFARLLEYYPEESFFQYSLLQSKARYGVEPPKLPTENLSRTELESELYEFLTGSLAIQSALQRETLRGSQKPGDQVRHVSSLRSPQPKSLDYEKLLAQKAREGITPAPHGIAKLVPADQYMLHFNSLTALGKTLDLATEWGDNLLHVFTERALDNRLHEKFEEQLCVPRAGLEALYSEQVIEDVALSGADPFLLEGTDLTLILHVSNPALYEQAAQEWLSASKEKHPQMNQRQFNYKGHRVSANYTNDRVVSAFLVQHGEYFIHSNSHRSIRRIIDAAIDEDSSLFNSLDYRYTTTVLQPSDGLNSGYLFASEEFVKRLVSPAAKIAQKRRLQCFNNLVMQNNASLFYRLEYGRAPDSLSELVDKRFVDADKITCPHGGAYAVDSEHDTCMCSLHNRLKYLTPNIELPVLNVSAREAEEYNRYTTRYASFWQQVFNPIALRIGVEPNLKLEASILPFANSELYSLLQSMVDKRPLPLDSIHYARSALISYSIVSGRLATQEFLQMIPGVKEVVQDDPTLTDMAWVGDRVSVHFCDGESILEIDPTRFGNLDLPLVGQAPTSYQAMASSVLMMANLPVYVTIDVENKEKGERLIQQFSETIFLKKGNLMGLPTEIDAYRLPDYESHQIYVIKLGLYAASVRLYASLVEDQLVLATKPEVLRQVIDVSAEGKTANSQVSHMQFRVNPRALKQLYDEVQLYWAEKSRTACHKNIMSIYNFHKIYDAPLETVSELSESKYGVRYFCPDNGHYSYDGDLHQVVCSVHGNREHSKQNPRLDVQSSFSLFIESLDSLTASLRFEKDALIGTINIKQSETPEKQALQN